MEQKWVDLSNALKSVGSYWVPRIMPESLAGAYYLDRAVIREEEGAITAYAALWSTSDPQWREIGTVWVREDKGGNGVMRDVVNELITKHVHPGEQLFFLTSDSKVMRIATWHSFKPGTNSARDVLKWASRLGIVARLPKSIHEPKAEPRAGERWLFIDS